MFGKRSQGDVPNAAPAPAPAPAAPSSARVQSAVGAKPAAPAPAQPRPAASPAPANTNARMQPSAEVPETPEFRSEAYYRVKSTIFNALIETIDLTQLAQLDPESARDEIRDIVAEIISIKNVVMSISEQEALL